MTFALDADPSSFATQQPVLEKLSSHMNEIASKIRLRRLDGLEHITITANLSAELVQPEGRGLFFFSNAGNLRLVEV